MEYRRRPDVGHDGNGFLVLIRNVTAANVAATIATPVVLVAICRCDAVETIDDGDFPVAYSADLIKNWNKIISNEIRVKRLESGDLGDTHKWQVGTETRD